MDSVPTLTHLALLKPIPPLLNLDNVRDVLPSNPCVSCASIVPDRRKIQKGTIDTDYALVDLYPDFPGLKAGCTLCKFLRKTIRKSWAVRPMEEWGYGPLREQDGFWDELLFAPWDGKVKISKVQFSVAKSEVDSADVVVGLNLDIGPATAFLDANGMQPFGEIGQTLGFRVFDSKDLDIGTKKFARRLPSTSTLSPENIDLISKWINECKFHHPKCRRDESFWVPSRLLDVGASDGMELIRLIETQTKDIRESYAALSHMWGNSSTKPPLRTLKSNYDSMLAGIDIFLLPKNFADAVRTTRKLGLRYLWIDSLCIIQDDAADWNREAVTMHMVYSKAEVTITATAATSSHDGFLPRDLSVTPVNKISYRMGEIEGGDEFMVICPNDDVESGNWSGDVDRSAWNQRGWTMQERSLSTSTLHFCKQKIYFECRTCRRSEEGEPYGDLRSYELWPRNESWMESIGTSSDSDMVSRKKLYKLWYLSVSQYMQRQLTKEFDKLPAIQSIAAEMESILKDSYITLAGMWKDNLQRDLLWSVRDSLRVKHPDKYRAPSWSWASLEAMLGWNEYEVKKRPGHSALPDVPFMVLNLIEGELSFYPAPFYLKVKGWTVNISFVEECDYDQRWHFGTRGVNPFDLFTSTDAANLNNLTEPLSLDQLHLKDRRQSSSKFAEGSLDMENQDDVSRFSRPIVYFHVDSSCRPSGLIVEILHHDPPVCKRVGVATIFDQSKNDELFTGRDDEEKFTDAIFRTRESVELLII